MREARRELKQITHDDTLLSENVIHYSQSRAYIEISQLKFHLFGGNFFGIETRGL